MAFTVKCAGWKHNKFVEHDGKSVTDHRVKFSKTRNTFGWIHNLKIWSLVNIVVKESIKCREDIYVCTCMCVRGGFVLLLFACFACPAHFPSSLLKHSSIILGITHHQLLIVLRPLGEAGPISPAPRMNIWLEWPIRLFKWLTLSNWFLGKLLTQTKTIRVNFRILPVLLREEYYHSTKFAKELGCNRNCSLGPHNQQKGKQREGMEKNRFQMTHLKPLGPAMLKVRLVPCLFNYVNQ